MLFGALRRDGGHQKAYINNMSAPKSIMTPMFTFFSLSHYDTHMMTGLFMESIRYPYRFQKYEYEVVF